MVVVMAPRPPRPMSRRRGPGRAAGGEAFVSSGVSRTIIGLVGDIEQFSALNLRS